MPSYRLSDFKDVQARKWSQRPFRVLFVGRIEQEKGVFDLLSIAEELRESGHVDIVFDVVGYGGELDSLREAARKCGLSDSFAIHGRADRPRVITFMERAHVVVVPTKSSITEGFNQVVVEAVLARTPVVTSRVCPALDLVREAAIEVPPDDIAAYCSAILNLQHDRALYEAKVAATESLRNKLTDNRAGWASVAYQLFTDSSSSTSTPNPCCAR
ncbi:hypothetical protein GCM10023325_20280 [Sphingomonas lutea]